MIDSNGLIKICDFGLARQFSYPMDTLTHEVETLWYFHDFILRYRAPEILLGTKKYSLGVDMWSVGAIFGEILNKKVLILC